MYSAEPCCMLLVSAVAALVASLQNGLQRSQTQMAAQEQALVQERNSHVSLSKLRW